MTEPEHKLIEEAKDGEIVYIPKPEPSPLALYAAAIEKGLSVEQLSGLLDLHERIEKAKAEAAYAADMALAQAEMPPLVCDATNPQTRSKYIRLETINRKCKPVYTAHRFSLEFGEGKTDLPNHCRTTCAVTHALGHSKTFHLDLPLDGVGLKGNSNMTAIHGRLSSDTYAMTRLLKKIFNLTVMDDASDDDGNAGSFITPDQIGEVNKAIGACEKAGKPVNFKAFLNWLGIETLDKLPQRDLEKALAELRRKLGQAQKQQETNK